jgi:flagellar protein FliO/FliZ
MPGSGLTSLLWFIAIIAMIPVALWLLKRTPMGGAGSQGIMRSIAVLPISTSQRIVTVEVGTGEGRRWLVLGVTPQSISTLHSMEPQAEAPPPQATPLPPFAQMLSNLRRPK